MALSPRPGGLPLFYFPTDLERTFARLLELDIATLALGHHYRTLSVSRDSVHSKENVRAYLKAARETVSIVKDALHRAAAAHPGAGFLEVARAATDLAAERLPIRKLEDGLASTGRVEGFYGYWQLLDRNVAAAPRKHGDPGECLGRGCFNFFAEFLRGRGLSDGLNGSDQCSWKYISSIKMFVNIE